MKENLVRAAIVAAAAFAYFVASKLQPGSADILKLAAGALIGLLFPQLAPKKNDRNDGGGSSGSGGTRDHVVFGPETLKSEPPGNDSSAATRLRFAALPMLGLLLALPSCSTMREVVWPTVVRCTPPAETIVSDLIAILRQDGGGALTERAIDAIEQLAAVHGPSAVTCAMEEVKRRLFGSSGEDGAVSVKAQQWLELKGVHLEEVAGAEPCSE